MKIVQITAVAALLVLLAGFTLCPPLRAELRNSWAVVAVLGLAVVLVLGWLWLAGAGFGQGRSSPPQSREGGPPPNPADVETREVTPAALKPVNPDSAIAGVIIRRPQKPPRPG